MKIRYEAFNNPVLKIGLSVLLLTGTPAFSSSQICEESSTKSQGSERSSTATTDYEQAFTAGPSEQSSTTRIESPKDPCQTDNSHSQNHLGFKYVGNLYSLKFHRPSCPFARQMWRSRRLEFAYRRQAISLGYRPCRYCLPPTWRTVHAVLLKSEPESSQVKNLNPGATIDQAVPSKKTEEVSATPPF